MKRILGSIGVLASLLVLSACGRGESSSESSLRDTNSSYVKIFGELPISVSLHGQLTSMILGTQDKIEAAHVSHPKHKNAIALFLSSAVKEGQFLKIDENLVLEADEKGQIYAGEGDNRVVVGLVNIFAPGLDDICTSSYSDVCDLTFSGKRFELNLKH